MVEDEQISGMEDVIFRVMWGVTELFSGQATRLHGALIN
jgi:hypothetical protein